MKKTPKSYWNHRVLAHKYKNEVILEIHEVFYTDGIPDSYTEQAIGLSGDSIKELNQTLTWMRKCLKKPILHYGKRFPEVYKPKSISLH